METRALAIAFFYAVGTGLGGIVGPLLFGQMIATNDRTWVGVAFLIGAGVMALGGIAELFLGVKAERASLEDIAKPLTAEEAERGALPGDEDTATAREAGAETDDERRWRERDERRSARERAGSRRYRPGPDPTGSFYSPGMLGTSLHSRHGLAEPARPRDRRDRERPRRGRRAPPRGARAARRRSPLGARAVPARARGGGLGRARRARSAGRRTRPAGRRSGDAA